MKDFLKRNKFWIGVIVGGTISAWFASKHPEETQQGFKNAGNALKAGVDTCKTGATKASGYVSKLFEKKQ